jgi:hypothetical protein
MATLDAVIAKLADTDIIYITPFPLETWGESGPVPNFAITAGQWRGKDVPPMAPPLPQSTKGIQMSLGFDEFAQDVRDQAADAPLHVTLSRSDFADTKPPRDYVFNAGEMQAILPKVLGSVVMVTKTRLNVRATPGTGVKVLATLEPNTKLTVSADRTPANAHYWRKVLACGVSAAVGGFVADDADYLGNP